ncbi:MAG: FAD-binding protein [Caldilineaceae bacterium]
MTVSAAFLDQLAAIVGADNVITRGSALRRGSQDFYWFSPVLKRELGDKLGDVIVQPHSVDELRAVIALAVNAGMPITRGRARATTARASRSRAASWSTCGLDGILDITSDFARVEAGVLLHRLEAAARQIGGDALLSQHAAHGHGRRLPGRRLGRRRFGHLGHALG